MCDADLGSLGSIKAALRGESLRIEKILIKKKHITIKEWNKINLDFIQNHKYFTKTAEKLFGETKKKNIEMYKEILE
jgi:hypothetical protein